MDDSDIGSGWGLNWKWRVLGLAAICALVYQWGGLIFVLMVPFIAFLLAAPFRDLPGRYVAWAKRRLWLPEHGRYHEFDGHHIRIHVDHEGTARAEVRDILRALRDVPGFLLLRAMLDRASLCAGPKGQRVVSLNAVIDAMHRVPDPKVIKFRQWFERQVTNPARRKHEYAQQESSAD